MILISYLLQKGITVMKKSITPGQIKETNRNLVYQHLYKNPDSSQQDISYALRLSRPTVTALLAELEQEGMICKNGVIASAYAGRKAAAYSVTPDYRIAIGAELLASEWKLVAVDLYGRELKRENYQVAFQNTPAYYDSLCSEILHFVKEIPASDAQVLGVGFAVQGLVSPDGRQIAYGKILPFEGLTTAVFSALPFPCRLIHDAASAAAAELWVSPELQNAVFLLLSEHFGAAFIQERSVSPGKHGHQATIEHIQLFHNGKQCYCGQRGCVETECSVSALLQNGENLPLFFAAARKEHTEEAARWMSWLSSLAEVINAVHLIYDCDYILGGHIAPFLKEEDLTVLYRQIREHSSFPEPDDFIRISKMPEHGISTGAALPFVQDFLNQM